MGLHELQVERAPRKVARTGTAILCSVREDEAHMILNVPIGFMQ
jgi:hypothetical protein